MAPLLLVLALIAAQDSTHTPKLEDRDWELRSLGGKPLPEKLRTIPTLRFVKGRVTGNSGCNRVFGSYEVKGKSFKFGMMGGTRMACAPPDIERPTLEMLGKVARYRLSAEGLEFLTAEGQFLARFVAR